MKYSGLKRAVMIISLLGSCSASADSILKQVTALPTSGAREVTPFNMNKEQFLAVPQLALDDMKMPPNMNGGNADADVLIYKFKNDRVSLYQALPGHGNESAQFFTIGKNKYLATCSVDSGPKPPFNNHTYQKLYRWDGKFFYPIQQFFSYAAKSWTPFTLEGNHYLGLANGVVLPDNKEKADTRSTIYRWNQNRFEKFQSFDTSWGYHFNQFNIGKRKFLGLTDHLKPSIVYEWKNNKFVKFQSFDESGGRVFYHFKIKDKDYLAVANINHPATVYLWNGSKFELIETLEGLGSRNFLYFNRGDRHYLLKVVFITGPRTAPEALQQSPIYEIKNDQFIEVDHIQTSGGVSASLFEQAGKRYIAVANSLSKDIRFRTDSYVYQIKK